MISIRRFLLSTLLISACLTAGLVAALSYERAAHEVEELFDAEMAQMARVLHSLLEQQLQSTQLSNLKQALIYKPYAERALSTKEGSEDDEQTRWGHKYEKKLAFRIWNNDGDQLISSQQSEEAALTFSPKPGFAEQAIGSYGWRTFTLYDENNRLWIKVGQRLDVREELITEIVLSYSLPVLLLLPILGLLIWLIIGRGLSPLTRLSGQIKQRDPNNLGAIQTESLPQEILPVVTATNSLMAKLQAALTREKEFTADAAHELRTPLAALKIHTQNLQYDNHDQQHARTLANIMLGIDRMTHVVEQLLTLSRLEHQHNQTQQTIVLAPLLQAICAEQSPLALDKQQHLNLDIAAQASIHGDPLGLEVLLRNLLNNAIRYTPAGGRIDIQLTTSPDRIHLSVCDNGPGIADSDKERVFQRFYRGAEQQEDGTGLGLAIVQEICRQHQATITLSDNLHSDTGSGLCVQIDFPLPDASEHDASEHKV